jgi:hypothetical protein
MIASGIEILRGIPDQQAGKILLSRHVNPNGAWVKLAVEKIADSIWMTFGSTLRSSSTAELRRMSELISRNTLQPLREDFTDPQDWFASFSGTNLRWEAIGILFNYWSFGAISSLDSDDVVRSVRADVSRIQLMTSLKEHASSCVALCIQSSNSNSLLLYLLYLGTLLQYIQTGDHSE